MESPGVRQDEDDGQTLAATFKNLLVIILHCRFFVPCVFNYLVQVLE